MKVAVLCKDGMVSNFGDTPEVRIYEIDRAHAVTNIETIPVEGEGYIPVSGVLIMNQVQAVICGGIGKQAFDMMQNLRAHVFASVKGEPDEAVQKLLRRELTELKIDSCDHLEDEAGGCSGDCSTCAYH